MIDLLRAEILKLRTTRTFVALVAAALLLALAIAALAASIGEPLDQDEALQVMIGDTSSLFILVLAVVGMTGEWRHRTITGTVLAAPDRVRLVLAKMAAYAAAGMALSIVVNVVVVAVAWIILEQRDQITPDAGEVAGVVLKSLVLAAFFGALGVAIGALVRNQAAAIVGLLVMLFIVEPAVLGLAPDVGRFGPLIGAPGGFLGDEGFEDQDDLLAAGPAFAVLIAWLVAAGAGAMAVLRSRDLT